MCLKKKWLWGKFMKDDKKKKNEIDKSNKLLEDLELEEKIKLLEDLQDDLKKENEKLKSDLELYKKTNTQLYMKLTEQVKIENNNSEDDEDEKDSVLKQALEKIEEINKQVEENKKKGD